MIAHKLCKIKPDEILSGSEKSGYDVTPRVEDLVILIAASRGSFSFLSGSEPW